MHNTLSLAAQCRIALRHKRIVAWHDASARCGARFHASVSFEHVFASTIAIDILNSAGIEAGTLQAVRPIPPDWKATNAGDLYTGMFNGPITDSHLNNGVRSCFRLTAATRRSYGRLNSASRPSHSAPLFHPRHRAGKR